MIFEHSYGIGLILYNLFIIPFYLLTTFPFNTRVNLVHELTKEYDIHEMLFIICCTSANLSTDVSVQPYGWVSVSWPTATDQSKTGKF